MRHLMILLLIALAGAGLIVWTRSRAQPVVDRDLAVLHQLQQAGSDLSKPHTIEFFLYFPSEQVAHEAAEQLRQASFTVKVDRGADNKNWLCLATKEMVPAHRDLLQVRGRFDELALRLGGEYDGWGTPVVP